MTDCTITIFQCSKITQHVSNDHCIVAHYGHDAYTICYSHRGFFGGSELIIPYDALARDVIRKLLYEQRYPAFKMEDNIAKEIWVQRYLAACNKANRPPLLCLGCRIWWSDTRWTVLMVRYLRQVRLYKMGKFVSVGTLCKSSWLRSLMVEDGNKENECMWAQWKRGEPPHLPLSQCTLTTTAYTTHVLQLDIIIRQASVAMATPANHYSDCPLAFSPEAGDDDQSYNCATPLVHGLETQYSNILDAPTPGFICSSQGYDHWSRSASVASYDQQPDVLGFIPLHLWDKDHGYNEVPPLYIHYDIEWRLKIGRNVILKETEENIVVDPASIWRLVLQPRLEEQLQKHVKPPRIIQPKSTDMVVSVTGRKERPLNKQFEGVSIDWSIVERKLLQWSDLFRNGKKLRVDICLHYTETERSSRNANDQNKRRKVGSSATERSLNELDAVDAQEFTTGKPPSWRHVYTVYRCPGAPCTEEPYCFYDRKIGKRRKLKAHHLRYLVRYYERGNPLESGQNVPKELRDLIEAEEKRLSEKKQSHTVAAAANVPPIQILMPAHASSEPAADRSAAAVRRIDLAGLHDVNLQQYCDWLKSRVQGDTQKADYQRATDFLIDHGFDLDLLYDDPDPTFLINEGKIKVGNARRYMKDIPIYIDVRLNEASEAHLNS